MRGAYRLVVAACWSVRRGQALAREAADLHRSVTGADVRRVLNSFFLASSYDSTDAFPLCPCGLSAGGV